MLGGSPPFFSPFLSFFLSSFFLSSNQTMLSLAQFSNFRGSQIGPLTRFNSHSIRRYVIFRSFFILITRFPITSPRGELNLRRFISRDQYLIESPRIESRRWRKKDTSSRQIVENDGYPHALITYTQRAETRFYDYEKREAKIGNLEETLLFDRAEFTNIRGEICLEFVLATIT